MNSPRLAAAELDALMAAFEAAQRPEPQSPGRQVGPVRPWDLFARAWIEREPLPRLDALGARFAEGLAARLGARLQLELRVDSAPWTLQEAAPPAALGAGAPALSVVDLGVGGGRALVALAPELARALVAAALGQRPPADEPALGVAGRAEAPAPRVTRLECRVLDALSDGLCAALAEGFAEIAPLSPRAGRFDTDARLRQVALPGERAVLLQHTLSGALRGKLLVLIPVDALAPMREALRGGPAQDRAPERAGEALALAVRRAPVELRVELARARVGLARLRDLRVGDVLPLDVSAAAPAVVRVAGQQRFAARTCTRAGRVAVELLAGAPRSARERGSA